MHISGAKFEEHCSNISRDIVDWVLYCFSRAIYDVITFLICILLKCKYLSLKWKKIFQKGKRHSSLLWKTFQISSNYFLLHRHFKTHCPVFVCFVQTSMVVLFREMSRKMTMPCSNMLTIMLLLWNWTFDGCYFEF